MGPTAFDGNLDLDELFFQRVLKYVSKNKAAKLFAHLLDSATNESVSSVTYGWVIIQTAPALYRRYCLVVLHNYFGLCFCSCVLVNRVTVSKLWPCLVQRITTLKSSSQVNFSILGRTVQCLSCPFCWMTRDRNLLRCTVYRSHCQFQYCFRARSFGNIPE